MRFSTRVNSSWDADAAVATVGQLADARLAWLEEPVPVDAPADVWLRLARAAPMPLAGGENMVTPRMFDRALADPSYPTPVAALANAGSCASADGRVKRKPWW